MIHASVRTSGKWHLGIGAAGEHLPTAAGGFGSFYGMPVTNVQSCMPGKTIYSHDTLLEFYALKMWHVRRATSLPRHDMSAPSLGVLRPEDVAGELSAPPPPLSRSTTSAAAAPHRCHGDARDADARTA